MRQQTVTISANPADVQQEANRIADILREQGNTVTVGPVYTLSHSHKRGLPAVDLTIEEPAVVVPAEVAESIQVEPAVGTAPAEAALASEDDPESWQTVGLSNESRTPDAIALDAALEEASPVPAAEPEPPVKNKGGRPKGSKTKVKEAATA